LAETPQTNNNPTTEKPAVTVEEKLQVLLDNQTALQSQLDGIRSTWKDDLTTLRNDLDSRIDRRFEGKNFLAKEQEGKKSLVDTALDIGQKLLDNPKVQNWIGLGEPNSGSIIKIDLKDIIDQGATQQIKTRIKQSIRASFGLSPAQVIEHASGH